MFIFIYIYILTEDFFIRSDKQYKNIPPINSIGSDLYAASSSSCHPAVFWDKESDPNTKDDIEECDDDDDDDGVCGVVGALCGFWFICGGVVGLYDDDDDDGECGGVGIVGVGIV